MIIIKKILDITSKENLIESIAEICDCNKDSILNIGGYKISIIDDSIVADRTEVFPDIKRKGRVFKSSKLNERYDLSIYIDNGIIEMFINDGKYVISNIVYGLKSKIELNNIETIKLLKL